MSGIFNAIIAFLLFLIAIVVVLIILFKPRTKGVGNSATSSGILGRIKAKKFKIPNLTPKTWLFRFVLVFGVLLAFGVYDIFSEDNVRYNTEDIKIDRQYIFVDGDDGDWQSLNSAEQEKYAVLIVPDEGRAVFFGRQNISRFVVSLGENRYPFKVEGFVDSGSATGEIILDDVDHGYGHDGWTVEDCTFVPSAFNANFQWGIVDFYSGNSAVRTDSIPTSLKGNKFDVLIVFDVPKGGELDTRNLRVER